MKIVNSPSIDIDIITQLKSHVYDIIGCCQDVHKELGPWLNEYVYQEAISSLGIEQRQQLWNYMRLTNTPVGILYNFAPV